MIRAGELNSRVTIEEDVGGGGGGSGIGGLGGDVPMWKPLRTVWAKVKTLVGRELFAAARLQSEATHEITIRTPSGLSISTRHRIIWKGRTLGIKSVANYPRQRLLVLVCADLGIMPPAPSPLEELFTHHYGGELDFLAFIDRFGAVIAAQAALPAYAMAFLDYDRSGLLDREDLDHWLGLLIWKHVTLVGGRLPFGATSDPLGLVAENTAAGRKTLIIDPQDPASVKVLPLSNNCETQGGVPDGSLWDGADPNVYRRTLLYDFSSLGEAINGATAPGGTQRRFPMNGGTVIVYLRGGTQTIDKEVWLRKWTAGWTDQSRIVIRNYPGERPTLHFGSSLRTDGPHAGSYRWDWSIVSSRESETYWEGIEVVGYRVIGGLRVFANLLFDFGAVAKLKLFNAIFRDHRGIRPSHPQAGALPELVDQAYLNCKSDAGTVIDRATQLGQSGVIVWGNGSILEDMYYRQAVDSFPDDGTYGGDGVDIPGNDVTVTRLTVAGVTPHFAVMLRGQRTALTFCDLANTSHVVLGSLNADDAVIEYCRLHSYAQIATEFQAALEWGGSRGRVRYNVIYNDGLEAAPRGWMMFANHAAGVVCRDNEFSHNVLYRVGLGEHPGGNGSVPGTDGMITGNDTHHNVVLDLPAAAKTFDSGFYDAPVYIAFNTTSGFGNEYRDNLIARLADDVNPTMLVTYKAATATRTTYPIANAYPGWTGNYSADPKFADPAGGDFTLLAGSPVAGLFPAAMPLSPTSLAYDPLAGLGA